MPFFLAHFKIKKNFVDFLYFFGGSTFWARLDQQIIGAGQVFFYVFFWIKKTDKNDKIKLHINSLVS